MTLCLADSASPLPVGKRILRALQSPLIHDPAHAAALREIFIAQLRNAMLWDHRGKPMFRSDIDDKTITALSTTYGWLVDFSAVRRDFGFDLALLDLVASRSYGCDFRDTRFRQRSAPAGPWWRQLSIFRQQIGYVITRLNCADGL